MFWYYLLLRKNVNMLYGDVYELTSSGGFLNVFSSIRNRLLFKTAIFYLNLLNSN